MWSIITEFKHKKKKSIKSKGLIVVEVEENSRINIKKYFHLCEINNPSMILTKNRMSWRNFGNIWN